MEFEIIIFIILKLMKIGFLLIYFSLLLIIFIKNLGICGIFVDRILFLIFNFNLKEN